MAECWVRLHESFLRYRLDEAIARLFIEPINKRPTPGSANSLDHQCAADQGANGQAGDGDQVKDEGFKTCRKRIWALRKPFALAKRT